MGTLVCQTLLQGKIVLAEQPLMEFYVFGNDL